MVVHSSVFVISLFIPKSYLQDSLEFLRQACWVAPKDLRFEYGCAIHFGVDVGARDVEVDVICVTFIMSA